MSDAKFDAYAQTYDDITSKSLRTSGESLEYFADYKVNCLERFGAPKDQPLLDYGCGIGNVTHKLCAHFQNVHGYDPSRECVRVARERMPKAEFYDDVGAIPDDHFGTVVIAGVLHHVPRAERPALCELVLRKLRPGGRLFVFEHNPLNPLTQHMVHTCEFDDDADLLWPWSIRRLLERASFRDVRVDFIVFFPRALARLRPLEPRLRWMPLGAQTLTIGAR